MDIRYRRNKKNKFGELGIGLNLEKYINVILSIKRRRIIKRK
jgi:hypothetical protein